MKIIKGYRLYTLEENQNRSIISGLKFTEYMNLAELNNDLKTLGYELKIKGFFMPYKFRSLRRNRTYTFSNLFETVADEFFVTYSYIVVDATEEEKERLAGPHIRIRTDNLYNECTAALIYHEVNWIRFREQKESIYGGKVFQLNRETGTEEEKNIVDPRYEMDKHIFNIDKLEYIH